jgi:hypothetical protein
MSPKRHSMNSWKSLLLCARTPGVIVGKVSVASIAIAIVAVIDAVFLVSVLFNAIALFGTIRLNS